MIKLFFSTFILIFLAELGDKTQLATMLMAAKSNHIWPVFLGSSLALICSSFMGVILGNLLTKLIPANYIQTGAGIAFVIIGILLIIGKL
ncbi:MAG: TMEM165/GDT1 family protein [Xylanivirga thermophila]|jgi:Ca2+/H+ antiporter, TMEM165/GDT1 family|uniref:TMEM165/GDT1 family protein n=1 Tax=Xylanivirga thermophila TaxID=2496273 RepID=UPI00101C50EF|nr:TMEM165/GDT1 family protein [Xylanivirga thermophila]